MIGHWGKVDQTDLCLCSPCTFLNKKSAAEGRPLRDDPTHSMDPHITPYFINWLYSFSRRKEYDSDSEKVGTLKSEFGLTTRIRIQGESVADNSDIRRPDGGGWFAK